MFNIFKGDKKGKEEGKTGSSTVMSVAGNNMLPSKPKDAAASVANSPMQTSLDPPSTLPELARDIYEKEETGGNLSTPSSMVTGNILDEKIRPAEKTRDDIRLDMLRNDVLSAKGSAKGSVAGGITDRLSSDMQRVDAYKNTSKAALEPSTDSVPSLDLNLIRGYRSSMKDGYASDISRDEELRESRIRSDDMRRNMSDEIYRQMLRDTISSSSSFRGMDAGFFKDFQDFIAATDMHDSSRAKILDDLLSKDLLERMTVYHDTRSNGLPFYLSDNELSITAKHSFDELKNLEHSWLINRQRLDSLKKVNAELELDIKLKSEELKRLLQEVVKRGHSGGRDGARDGIGGISGSPFINPIVQNERFNEKFSEIVNEKFNMTASTADTTKYFYARDGKTLKSIADFIGALKVMDDTTFYHHVNDHGNDFANWISGVFGDVILAERIRPISNKGELLTFLLNHAY